MTSSFIDTRRKYVRSVSIPILALSVFLTSIFIASCGDEGDTTDGSPGMTDVLQPTSTPPPAQTPIPPADPGGVEQPIVEEPVVPDAPKTSFKDDIQPILAERCAVPGCHAAPGAAGLDLTTYDTFKKGGNTGPGFIAGDGKGSHVVKRIDGGGMPPIPPPLNAAQVKLFIDWIDEGAQNN